MQYAHACSDRHRWLAAPGDGASRSCPRRGVHRKHEHAGYRIAPGDAAGRGGPDWEAGFSAMLDYAERKGWTDTSREAVRAHVEWED